VAFIENQGQWDFPASYVARMGPMTVFLEDWGWIFTVEERKPKPPDPNDFLGGRGISEFEPGRGVAVRMRFGNSAAPARAIAEDRLAGVHNYFHGNDPSRWRTGVPLHGAVRLIGLYPGIDVRVRSEDRHLEYDLLVRPGPRRSGRRGGPLART
jgi:hypothetical protein